MTNKIIFAFFLAAAIVFPSNAQYKFGSARKDYVGYLFAYFKGNDVKDEAVCYAISLDGYSYLALNNNNPVLDSKQIS